MTRLIFPFLLCAPLVALAQNPPSNTYSSATVSPGSLVPASTPKLAPHRVSELSSNSSSDSESTKLSGIVPPKLVHTLSMKDDGNQHVHLEGRQRIVLVDLIVNEAGEPTNLQLPNRGDDALDVEVLATVGKFRYQPGTVNGRPVPMPIHVHYVVPVGAIY